MVGLGLFGVGLGDTGNPLVLINGLLFLGTAHLWFGKPKEPKPN